MSAVPAFLNSSPVGTPSSSALPSGKSARGSNGDRISTAGTDFEAVLLTQWLQSAEKSFATVPTDSEDTDSASDQMKEVGFQAVAQQLSRSDVLGIAHMVTDALRHSASSANAPARGSSSP